MFNEFTNLETRIGQPSLGSLPYEKMETREKSPVTPYLIYVINSIINFVTEKLKTNIIIINIILIALDKNTTFLRCRPTVQMK